MSVIMTPSGRLITYLELGEGSPVYSFGPGTTRVERKYRIAWEDREDFVRALLGYCYIVNREQPRPWNTYVRRFIPHFLNDVVNPLDGKEYLYAVSVTQLEGRGGYGVQDKDDIHRFQYALVTVQYEGLTYRIIEDAELQELVVSLRMREQGLDDPTTLADKYRYPDEAAIQRYVTRTLKPSAEFIHLPRGVTHWVLSARPLAARPAVDFATVRLIPSVEVVYTWHQVPFVPDAVFTHIGTVNLKPFSDSTRTYNPGTLLLLSTEVKTYRGSVGNFVQDITYRMKYYEPEPHRGHNFFLRYFNNTKSLFFTKITTSGDNDEIAIPADTPGLPHDSPYKVITPPGSGIATYRCKDFNDLFRFNTA